MSFLDGLDIDNDDLILRLDIIIILLGVILIVLVRQWIWKFLKWFFDQEALAGLFFLAVIGAIIGAIIFAVYKLAPQVLEFIGGVLSFLLGGLLFYWLGGWLISRFTKRTVSVRIRLAVMFLLWILFSAWSIGGSLVLNHF